MFDYDGKVALVSGGSSGIGLGIAQALVERGARVAIGGTDTAKLAAARERLGADRSVTLAFDVRDGGAWDAAAARTVAELGPIDVLVLNAGAQGSRGPIESIAPDEWRWVWDVNVHGVYEGLRACLPAMKSRGTPARVMATASIAAFVPRATVAAYGASKAATVAIMEAVRLELAGTAIAAAVFCPALVRTDFASTMLRHLPSATPETFSFMHAFAGQGLDPLDVGRYVLDQLAAERFYILSHPEMVERAEPRLREIRSAFDEQAPLAAAAFPSETR